MTGSGAIERIEIGFVLHGLRRVTLEVDHLAADDDLVAGFDLCVAGGKLLVAEIHDAEGIELVAGGSVIGDVERAVAILGRELFLDLRNLALHIDVLGRLSIGSQCVDVLQHGSHVVG